MITESELYWITRLNYILGLLYFFGLVLMLSGTLFTIMWHSDWNCKESKERFRKDVKHPMLILMLGAVFFTAALFIPSTKEMCAILIIPKIVNNEKVQQLPDKVLDLTEEWLDELKPKRLLQTDRGRDEK